MLAPDNEPMKEHHHPQIFRDDTAIQQALDAIEKENHWLDDFLARFARAMRSISNRKK
jgi:hypothetical protein